jgi:hypothetical protein
MSRSTSDRILEEWEAAASHARRPTMAPRPKVFTSVLAPASVGVLALVVVVAALVWIRPQNAGVATQSRSPTATTQPTESPTTTAVPSPTSPAEALPIGSPQPGDAAAAAEIAARYEDALVSGDWRVAWNLLAPEQQTHWGSYDTFVSQRSQYFARVNGRYTAMTPSHDADAIRGWVVPENYPAAPIYPATPTYDRAFLIRVDYPAIAQLNSGWEVLLASTDPSGTWRIWQVR